MKTLPFHFQRGSISLDANFGWAARANHEELQDPSVLGPACFCRRIRFSVNCCILAFHGCEILKKHDGMMFCHHFCDHRVSGVGFTIHQLRPWLATEMARSLSRTCVCVEISEGICEAWQQALFYKYIKELNIVLVFQVVSCVFPHQTRSLNFLGQLEYRDESVTLPAGCLTAPWLAGPVMFFIPVLAASFIWDSSVS